MMFPTYFPPVGIFVEQDRDAPLFNKKYQQIYNITGSVDELLSTVFPLEFLGEFFVINLLHRFHITSNSVLTSNRTVKRLL